MRFKLGLLLFLLVTAVLVTSSIFSYHALHSELNARFEENKQSLASRLQMNVALAIWNFDKEQATTIVDAELDSADVARIDLYQRNPDYPDALPDLFVSRSRKENGGEAGQADTAPADRDRMRIPLYADFAEHAAGQNATQLAAQADTLEAEKVRTEMGHAEITFSRQRIDDLLAEQVQRRIIEVVLLNLLLGLVLFFAMSRMVIRPLAQLSRAFKDLARNPQADEIRIRGHDEFGEVVDAFNQIERRLVLDIDRRVEAENKLRASNAELTRAVETLKLTQDSLVQSEKFASLGSLVAGIAHEINTPVGVAVTGASFLAEEAHTIEKLMGEGAIRKSEVLHFIASVKEGAHLVLSNAQRAAHLIQSFKQVAADETSEARREFDLCDYLDEVLTSLRPKYKKTRVRVGFSCPDGILMNTYPGLLTQVLSNLVINALTHGYDENEAGEITVRAAQDGQWAVIECGNDGKRIPPENLSRVFDPFFTTGRAQGGTGLGLNIVFNIVSQRLGGTIKVASTESDGTLFTVRIPRMLPETESKEKTHDIS